MLFLFIIDACTAAAAASQAQGQVGAGTLFYRFYIVNAAAAVSVAHE